MGNLNFHAVRYVLVLFKAREQVREFLGVFFAVDKLLCHAYHALNTLGVYGNFFLCLGYVQLGGVHQTA